MTLGGRAAAGPEMRVAGRHPWSHLVAARPQASRVRAASERAIAQCGLESVAERTVGDLSTGQRRLVELARAIASGFDFLLLDEPSSGLDPAETERFVSILHDLIERDGIGLLFV